MSMDSTDSNPPTILSRGFMYARLRQNSHTFAKQSISLICYGINKFVTQWNEFENATGQLTYYRYG